MSNHNLLVPYFRLEDSLCRRFLELATDPRDFEGLKLLFPFVREMPEYIGPGIRDIVSRVFVGAPRQAVGQPLLALLDHPLLRLAKELYPNRAVECQTMLGFLREELRARGVTSENECPTSELELGDWIAAGMNYGRKVQAKHPEILENIFAGYGEKRLEEGIDVVRQVVAAAGGTNPDQLLGPLKRWQQSVYGWLEPDFYGEELARVVYFSDFAVWIPWVCDMTISPNLKGNL